MSEDVLAAIQAKKLGIKVKRSKNECKIFGNGFEGYNTKNFKIDAKNSGTWRLILGFLTNSPHPIKLIETKVYLKEILRELLNL